MTKNRLSRSLFQAINALSRSIEARDPYTEQHQNGVAIIARHIGELLDFDESSIECLRVSGTLHDIGKIGIPAEILTKPGRLTREEYDLVKQHTLIGKRILRAVEFPWPVADIVEQHHERIDGSGYPHGLDGEDIEPEAHVIGVADVVESMLLDRPYRKGLGLDAALGEIRKNRGKLYDPEIVDACIELFTNKRHLFGIDRKGNSELRIMQQLATG